jgi:thioredoxin-like negative regulator of GroEL
MVRYVHLFTSPTCKPCGAMKPLYNQTCAEREIQLVLHDVAREEAAEFAATVGVQSVPTALLLDADGGEVERIIGAKSRSFIESRLDQ